MFTVLVYNSAHVQFCTISCLFLNDLINESLFKCNNLILQKSFMVFIVLTLVFFQVSIGKSGDMSFILILIYYHVR